MDSLLVTYFNECDISHVLRAAIFDAILSRKTIAKVHIWYLGGCFLVEVSRDSCKAEAYPWFREGDYESVKKTLISAIPSWRKIEDEIYEDKKIYSKQPG